MDEAQAHSAYLRTLAAMTPDQRLAKAFELTALARRLFRDGLRQQFPQLDDAALHRLYLERLALCHNQNW